MQNSWYFDKEQHSLPAGYISYHSIFVHGLFSLFSKSSAIYIMPELDALLPPHRERPMNYIISMSFHVEKRLFTI